MLKKIVPAIALALGAQCAYSAQYNETELDGMFAEIEAKGAVPVRINLFKSELDEVIANAQAVSAKAGEKSALLLEELKGGYWEQGKWDSSLGQIELYVNKAGLEKLIESDNAAFFRSGQSWRSRTLLRDIDNSLSRIENDIAAQGYAEVEAVLNIDGLNYTITETGGYSIDMPAAASMASTSGSLRQSVLSKLSSTARNREVASMASNSATLTLKINYQDFVELVQNDNVRHLRSTTPDETPQTYFDTELQSFFGTAPQGSVASNTDGADVILDIRNPLLGGKISPASFEIAKNQNEETLRDVLAKAGIDDIETLFPGVGAAQVKINRAQYLKLQALQDPRLRSVIVNKPAGVPMLNVSTQTLNLPLAWQSGFRGAGQMIAVLDTGVQLTHNTFKDAQGNSRVAYEGCFGTNSDGYKSICPEQDANGDSPFDYRGSATYSTAHTSGQHHGTHVTGIAAGSSSTYPGMAPDAQIIPIQVFSFKQNAEPVSYLGDMLTAFEAGVSESRYSDNFPLSINLSLGWTTSFNTNCDAIPGYSLFADYVNILRSRRIPVIVSSGNEGFRNGLPFPACISHTIKVGSLANNGTRQTISDFTNLGANEMFTGPIYLVPGAPITSSVTSTTSTAMYGAGSGTSMAAPHVTGLFALAKSAMPDADMDQIIAWIDANFTDPVQSFVCIQGGRCFYDSFKALQVK